MSHSPSSSATLPYLSGGPAPSGWPRRRSDSPHVSGPEFVKQWRRDVALHGTFLDEIDSLVLPKSSPLKPPSRPKPARGCRLSPWRHLRDFSRACWRRLLGPQAKAYDSLLDAETCRSGSASEHSWQVWTGLTPLGSPTESNQGA